MREFNFAASICVAAIPFAKLHAEIHEIDRKRLARTGTSTDN